MSGQLAVLGVADDVTFLSTCVLLSWVATAASIAFWQHLISRQDARQSTLSDFERCRGLEPRDVWLLGHALHVPCVALRFVASCCFTAA